MSEGKSQMPPPPGMEVESPEAPVLDLDGHAEVVAPVPAPPVEIPKPPSRKKIKVVANRPGFIHSVRRAAGDKFEVTEGELGSWMDCEDPMEQKKHLARIADKKRKINAKSIRDQEKELADE